MAGIIWDLVPATKGPAGDQIQCLILPCKFSAFRGLSIYLNRTLPVGVSSHRWANILTELIRRPDLLSLHTPYYPCILYWTLPFVGSSHRQKYRLQSQCNTDICYSERRPDDIPQWNHRRTSQGDKSHSSQIFSLNSILQYSPSPTHSPSNQQ